VLASALRLLAARCRAEPAALIATELRALADLLYPPIKGGTVIRDFGRNGVARNSQFRPRIRIS
jgi:hypothetical protein